MKLLKKVGRHLSATIKIGIVIIIPFAIIGYFGWVLWESVASIGWKPLPNQTLNFLINMGLIIIGLYLAGWLLGRSRLRNITDTIFQNLPVVSYIMKFIPSKEQLEKFKNGQYPEVAVDAGYGIRLLGIVVKEWQDIDNREWCRVIIGTTPILFTGNLLEVEKNRLIFTGRKGEATFHTYLSFGIR